MRQTQELAVQQVVRRTLIRPSDCDDLIMKPRPHVTRELQLLIINGQFVPALDLRRGKHFLRIQFQEGIPLSPVRTAAQRLKSFRRNVSVSFCQEDPRVPEVFVSLRYNNHRYEAMTTRMALDPFLLFPLEDDDPAEPDTSEVNPADYVCVT